MNVLVTDGENRAALAIVRSLGRAGHWIAVGERTVPALAQTSRYCARQVHYPDPARAEGDFIEALCKTARDQRIDVILPVTDITTMLVTSCRHLLPAGCRIPFAPSETIQRAADKVGVLQAAERLGVPIPRTVVVENAERRPDLDLAFPVVIKPARSRVQTPGGWISCTVSYASSPEQLWQQLASRRAEEFPIALQERVMGPGLGAFFCYHGGSPIARFAHRRLREKPPSGGVSVLCESVPIDPGVDRYARLLLDDLQWEGVAMVEFKLDERDNVPKLMEINGRFWGSLQLAIDAGVDFPRILLATIDGTAPASPPPYRIGVRSRWFWGDVDALLIQLFGRWEPGGSPRMGRLSTLGGFLHLWGRNLHYENPQAGDLRPWLYETRRWLTGVR